MIRVSIAFLFVLSWFHSHGQSDVDYTHKSIYKAIEKKLDIDDPDLFTLEVSGSSINTVSGSFFKIGDYHPLGYVYVGRAFSCRTGGCSINNSEKSDHISGEYFDYFILYDTLGKVQQVKIFNYQATHGHEVSVKGWLKQFIGYAGSSDLTVGKDIDGISGATVSVYALTTNVESKTKYLNEYLRSYTYQNNPKP